MKIQKMGRTNFLRKSMKCGDRPHRTLLRQFIGWDIESGWPEFHRIHRYGNIQVSDRSHSASTTRVWVWNWLRRQIFSYLCLCHKVSERTEIVPHVFWSNWQRCWQSPSPALWQLTRRVANIRFSWISFSRNENLVWKIPRSLPRAWLPGCIARPNYCWKWHSDSEFLSSVYDYGQFVLRPKYARFSSQKIREPSSAFRRWRNAWQKGLDSICILRNASLPSFERRNERWLWGSNIPNSSLRTCRSIIGNDVASQGCALDHRHLFSKRCHHRTAPIRCTFYWIVRTASTIKFPFDGRTMFSINTRCRCMRKSPSTNRKKKYKIIFNRNRSFSSPRSIHTRK